MSPKIPLRRIKLIGLIVCFVVLIIVILSMLRTGNEKSLSMKYILILGEAEPMSPSHIDHGQDTFFKRKCPVNNCFVTWDKKFLRNETSFDVVVFHAPDLVQNKITLPKMRMPYQLYVFSSMESSGYYPLPENKFDNFFNFTWTYKLDSDLYFGYITIRDAQGKLIGPKENMTWLEENKMSSVNALKDIKEKSLVGAWIVSNCYAPSKRQVLVERLQEELKKYNQMIDIYGWCGPKQCPVHWMPECMNNVKKKYHFYLALENSFSKDYVTEKLLTALHNYAIPVVYGGADYTRFMPEGIYLNANKLSVEELAKQMIDIMNDSDKYSSFFKWRNHYSYYDLEGAIETDPYCKLCEYVNTFNGTKTVNNIANWWNQ